ncbi:transposase DNA-binding-containing protein [Thiococcus pfennigii]|uniref:transposase DNA-binding-containing protein n=1 Tax=Thiococcus pfennigii TaxID=1057 RepID=UPI00190615CB|nr:transposase DNA-binding-containing protein [Thiococcus pfennigii]MBK1733570.1 hypothetical protein [Thiococcus pfennigii]
MSALAAELSGIALGDRRLNRRAGQLIETSGEQPTFDFVLALQALRAAEGSRG